MTQGRGNAQLSGRLALATGTQDKRRKPRIPLEALRTEVQLHGMKVPVRIGDLSEQGVRLLLDAGLDVHTDDEVQIAVGHINPNIRGRVRWTGPVEGAPDQVQIGVEFESFVLETPPEDEIQDLLEAWREVSHTYSVYESFLHILEALDFEIVDGQIEDISDAVYSTVVWIDQRLGPVNLWAIMHDPGGEPTCHLTVERHPVPGPTLDQRTARVREVVEQGITQWYEGLPYLYGDSVVTEYLGTDTAQIDLLQKLTLLLGRRMQFWTRLLMKNIALQLLGEEIGRHRGR